MLLVADEPQKPQAHMTGTVDMVLRGGTGGTRSSQPTDPHQGAADEKFEGRWGAGVRGGRHDSANVQVTHGGILRKGVSL